MASLTKGYQSLLRSHPVVTKCTTSACLFAIGDGIAQSIAHMKRSSPNSQSNNENASYDFSRTLKMAFYGGCIYGFTGQFWYRFVERYVPGNEFRPWLTKLGLHCFGFAPVSLSIFNAYMSITESFSHCLAKKCNCNCSNNCSWKLGCPWSKKKKETSSTSSIVDEKGCVNGECSIVSPPIVSANANDLNDNSSSPLSHMIVSDKKTCSKGCLYQSVKTRVINDTPKMWMTGNIYWIPILALNYRFIPMQYRLLFDNVASVGWTTYLSWIGNSSKNVNDK